jgi:hypothetical protein
MPQHAKAFDMPSAVSVLAPPIAEAPPTAANHGGRILREFQWNEPIKFVRQYSDVDASWGCSLFQRALFLWATGKNSNFCSPRRAFCQMKKQSV